MSETNELKMEENNELKKWIESRKTIVIWIFLVLNAL